MGVQGDGQGARRSRDGAGHRRVPSQGLRSHAMHKLLIGGIAGAAILFAAVAGFRLGAGTWPDPQGWLARTADRAKATFDDASLAAPAERKVLYWKDPDGRNDFVPRSE